MGCKPFRIFLAAILSVIFGIDAQDRVLSSLKRNTRRSPSP